MDFFEKTFGFKEENYQSTKRNLMQMATFQDEPINGSICHRERCDFRLGDGRILSAGIFSMPSVAQLRERAKAQFKDPPNVAVKIQITNIRAESRSLHTSDMVTNRDENRVIVVQAASQFNLLEFPTPTGLPESGISKYVFDRTQGPACAIACTAGTAYRNYLVPVPFANCTRTSSTEVYHRGQTSHLQLNGLVELEDYIQKKLHTTEAPWQVQNGYIQSTRMKLGQFNQYVRSVSDTERVRDQMVERIRIGVQEETTVTDDPSFQTKVTQTYNSAVSIGYSGLDDEWEPLAKIVLDATYEATLLTAILKSKPEKPPPIVFLTMVGGGVFKNRSSWIQQSILNACQKMKQYGASLDVRIVHFRSLDEDYRALEGYV